MMPHSRTLLGWTLLAAAALSGCTGGDGGSSSDVVAYVGDEAITSDELMQRMMEQRFEIVQATLQRLTADKLLFQ